MSVAWSRFDTEVAQLKRLSIQTCTQPASQPGLRSHARRQSAVNRRAVANLKPNMTSQATSAGSVSGSDVLVTQLTDNVAQEIPAEALPPCSSSAHLSAFMVNSPATTSTRAYPLVAHSSHVMTSQAHTVQGTSNITNLESESDTVDVKRTDQTQCPVENLSHHQNELLRLIPSASSESANINSVSALTSVANVGACRQVSDTVSTEALSQLCQPSAPDQHQHDGLKTVFC